MNRTAAPDVPRLSQAQNLHHFSIKALVSDFEKDSVRREILGYLAGQPRRLQDNDPKALGNLALQLGNCLVWIHSWLEDGPEVYQPISQNPQSLFALGKQLQETGRVLIDAPVSQELENRLAEMQSQMGHLQRDQAYLNSRLMEQKGGAK